MQKNRLEAFSDGVLAIALTIMVLELRPPHDISWTSMLQVLPHFTGYALSFLYVAIYWNNHHHMLHVTRKVTGGVLWANNHLLFWLTLVPFVTAMVGEHPLDSVALALYGFVLLMAGFAYFVLARVIVRTTGTSPELATALGTGWKGYLSLISYVASIPLAFWLPVVSQALFVVVALMWLIPDRRIEHHLKGESTAPAA
jgi:uncharacterized membrane protein